MREKLISIIERENDCTGVTESSTFESLGLDSLDFILIINEIRNEIGPISDADARKCETVGDLLRAIELDHISA